MFKAFFSKLALSACALFLGSAAAWATAYTLDTTVVGDSESINGALFNQSQSPSGSGGYTDLFRIQYNGTESGYNYAGPGNQAPFNQSGGVGMLHINLEDLPVVNIGGINYVQLHFDANNSNGLTFTDFRIYQHSDPSNQDTQILVTTEANLGNLGTLVYSMLGTNAGGSNTLTLTDFPSGSGTDNMTINIPVDNFLLPGWNNKDDLYIFAKTTSSDGGFEEFAFLQGTGTSIGTVTPEAHTVWGGGVMVASLLVGSMVQRRRKRIAAAKA
jgi:hypothetical protein